MYSFIILHAHTSLAVTKYIAPFGSKETCCQSIKICQGPSFFSSHVMSDTPCLIWEKIQYITSKSSPKKEKIGKYIKKENN